MTQIAKPKSKPSNLRNKVPEWTVIIYMAAESDLQEDFKDVYDQLANVGSNPDEVNFVVLFDGLSLGKGVKGDSKGNGNDGDLTVYRVMRYNYFDDVTEKKKYDIRFKKAYDDLTVKKNLVHVLRKIKKTFQANNYGFIYKGHGGPSPDINNEVYTAKAAIPMLKSDGNLESQDEIEKRMKNLLAGKGLVFESLFKLHDGVRRSNPQQVSSSRPDERLMALYYNSNKKIINLTYLKFSRALKEVFGPSDEQNKARLRFVCLDCCWGQTIENGIAFQDVTNYLVASVDEMPILGIGYEGFCNFLLRQPDINPGELADLIVAEYFRTEHDDYLSDELWKDMGVSLTCVETTYLKDITSLFRKLCDHLIKKLPTHFYIVHLARLQCMAYTYKGDPNEYEVYNIDLIWFLENLQFYNKDSSNEVVDNDLDQIISELLRTLSLYYIKSYLSSNYEVRKPERNGKTKMEKEEIPDLNPMVGGKGIGIIFPSRLNQFKRSVYKDVAEDLENISKSDMWFFKKWGWSRFVYEFVQRKERIIRGGDKLKQEEFEAFNDSPFRTYLEFFNAEDEDSLKSSLNRARHSVKCDNLEHKWVKVKKRSKHKVKKRPKHKVN